MNSCIEESRQLEWCYACQFINKSRRDDYIKERSSRREADLAGRLFPGQLRAHREIVANWSHLTHRETDYVEGDCLYQRDNYPKVSWWEW